MNTRSANPVLSWALVNIYFFKPGSELRALYPGFRKKINALSPRRVPARAQPSAKTKPKTPAVTPGDYETPAGQP